MAVGFGELKDYHLLYKDFRINLDTVHFLWFGLKSTLVKSLSSVSVCKPLYPCISLLCFQEFSDAILEWQPALQHWLRLMELILVPRLKGERSHLQCQKDFLVPGLGVVWCYRTHHTSPLEPLFVCLHNRCLLRY